MSKLKVAILFGGKSTEHEVSLQSAKSIISAIDPTKYDIQLIGIDKTGKWFLNEQSHYLLNENNPKLVQLNKSNIEISLSTKENLGAIVNVKTNQQLSNIDVVFPVLHGSFGEDGTIQGLLKSMNIPFVGADVLGSAIGMDKDVAKRLLRDANIAVADFMTLTKKNPDEFTFLQIQEKLGLPLFIKPANAGSSVGVHKVTNELEYQNAIVDAFQYDKKILIEEAIAGKEIECAVLGNDTPMASVVGEVIPNDTFYSYEAKYINEDGAILEIPANIDPEVAQQIRDIAVQVFKVLCCEGLARIDFFLKPDNTVILNEINTMPGFTNISMYPKLWEATGLSYSHLIDTLIELALERHKENRSINKIV